MDTAALQEALKKHKGNQTAAAKFVGLTRSTFQRRLAGMAPRAPEKPVAGRSLKDFRAEHDKAFIVPQRIKEGLAKLGDGWDYEVSFAKLCGVSLADLGAFRDQFADHVVQLRREGRRAWAGTKANAQKMRAML